MSRARTKVNAARAGVLGVVVAAGLVAAAPSGAAPTCTSTWDGGGDGTHWGDASNWSGDQLPGSTSHACIPDVAVTTRVVVDQGVTVGSFEASEPLTVLADLTLTSATDTSTASVVDLGGSLNGPGGLKVSTELNTSGAITGGATVELASGGHGTLHGGTFVYGGTTLRLSGTTTWDDGRVYVDGLLDVTGTLDATAENEIARYNSGIGEVHVSGAITRSRGTGSSTRISAAVQNTGTISSSAGTLELAGPAADARSTGTFGVAGGDGRVDLTGSFNVASPAKLVGNVDLTGSLDASSAFQITGDTVLRGYLGGTGTTTVSGTLRWASGTMGGSGTTATSAAGRLRLQTVAGYGPTTLYIDNGRKLTLAGATDWDAHNVNVASNVAITNSGTLTANAPNAGITGPQPGTNPPVLQNTSTGRILRTANADTTTSISIPLRNDGIVRSQAGTLLLNGGGGDVRVAGRFGQAGDTGTVELGGVFRVGDGGRLAAASVSGRLDVGGTVLADGPVTQGGEVTGDGTLQIGSTWAQYGNQNGTGKTVVLPAGVMRLYGPSCSCYGVNIDRDLRSEGELRWLDGTLSVGDGVTIENVGTFRAESPGVLQRSGTGAEAPVLANTGAITRTQGADSDTDITIPVDNDGTISVAQGRLRLGGGGGDSTATGRFGTSGDLGTLEFGTGRFRTASGAALAGNVTVGTYADLSVEALAQAGNVELLGTISGAGRLEIGGQFTWWGGTMTGAGVTRLLPNATFKITTTSYCCTSTHLVDRTFRNEGTGTWESGPIVMGRGAALENAGTFTAQNAGSIYAQNNDGASPIVVNTGTWKHQGGQNVSVPFTNDGTVELRDGRFTVGSYTQSAQGKLSVTTAGPNAESDYGVLAAGDVRLGGTLTFAATGYAPTGTTTFSPVRWSTRRGAFATIDGFASGTTSTPSYLADHLDVAVTPPASAARRAPAVEPDPAPVAATPAATPAAPRSDDDVVVTTRKRTVVVPAGRKVVVQLRRLLGRSLGKKETVKLARRDVTVKLDRRRGTVTFARLKAGATKRVRLVVTGRSGTRDELVITIRPARPSR